MCTVRSPEFTATSHAAAVHLHAFLLSLLLQWPPDISPFTLLARRRLHLLRPYCDPFDSLLEDDAFDWLDSPGPPPRDAAAADKPPSPRPGSPIEDDALPARSAALPGDVDRLLPLWREACPAGLRHAQTRFLLSVQGGSDCACIGATGCSSSRVALKSRCQASQQPQQEQDSHCQSVAVEVAVRVAATLSKSRPCRPAWPHPTRAKPYIAMQPPGC